MTYKEQGIIVRQLSWVGGQGRGGGRGGVGGKKTHWQISLALSTLGTCLSLDWVRLGANMWVDIKPSKKRVSLICSEPMIMMEMRTVMMRYIKEGNLQWTMVGRWCVSNCKIHRTHSNYPSHLICEMRWQSLNSFFLRFQCSCTFTHYYLPDIIQENSNNLAAKKILWFSNLIGIFFHWH